MTRSYLSKAQSERTLGLAMFPAIAVAWILWGCASPSALDAPVVSSEEREAAVEAMTSDILKSRVEYRKRMLDIEYRLAKLVASRCGEMRRPHPGVLLTTLEGFGAKDAGGLALDRLEDSPEPLTIVYVVPGGSFDRGGLRKGDQILAIDDVSVSSPEDVSKLMLSSADRRSARVKIRRTGFPAFEAWVPLVSTCPIRLLLTADALILSWQTERLVLSIPIGLVRHVSDDATLAVVIAHQFAHTLFDQPTDDALTAEMRADRIGLKMAAAAGYEIGGAVDYWEAVAMEYPSLIGEAPSQWRPLAWSQDDGWIQISRSHPEIARRLQAIRSIVNGESPETQARTKAPEL